MSTSTSSALLPVHPERTDDRATLRWRFGAGLGGPDASADDHAAPWAAAWAADVDAAFADLIAEHVVTSAHAEPDAVRVTLAPEQTWHTAVRPVRAAVQRAGAQRTEAQHHDDAGARPATPADPAERRAALETAVREALDEVVAPYAAGHGGGVQLLEVTTDVVRVRLVGACHGCPAAGLTVHARLEALVRQRAPWLARVELDTGSPASGWLLRRS